MVETRKAADNLNFWYFFRGEGAPPQLSTFFSLGGGDSSTAYFLRESVLEWHEKQWAPFP